MVEFEKTSLGKQLVVELYNCKAELFDDVNWIEQTMNEAALAANATIVQSVFHKFSPIGISGVVVISESHLAIHTWPEHNYAAVDIFTCGDILDGTIAAEYLSKLFKAESCHISHVARGLRISE